MKKVLRFRVVASTVFLLCVMTAIASPAQTLTTVHSFDGRDGANPYAGLVQATDGNLYGTTEEGGAKGYGSVFKITPSGTATTLHSFDVSDGANPYAGLVQATNGYLYGTTENGGADAWGTVFKITPDGTLTTLHSFDLTDGAEPQAGLVQGTDGNLYGTAYYGGAYSDGTVFKITPDGTLTRLHSFDGSDGVFPVAALIQATAGNLYGTTEQGGMGYGASGTVFKITPSGTLTTLYSFDGSEGSLVLAGLVQATTGDLYGTARDAGDHGEGTIFEFSPSGAITKRLYSFCAVLIDGSCMDGAHPVAGLVQGTDGNLYGITNGGGVNFAGTVFKITPGGTLTTLYSFCSQSGCADGKYPYAGLVQDTNGDFYGTTEQGGPNNSLCTDGCGTVFSLSVGLGPFVETQPAFGKVGAMVKILGTKLTGATSVTFNGTAATFTVASNSEITTTVPTGATSGKVQVTTPHGTLTSNVVFRVK